MVTTARHSREKSADAVVAAARAGGERRTPIDQ